MSESLSKVAVVTGSSSGIGRATAIHLAKAGYSVYGTVRRESRLDTLKRMAAEAEVDIRLVQLDVTDNETVESAFAEILHEAGRIDVLVNNAGIGGQGVAEEITAERYLEIMNVNLCGAIRCLHQVLPGMRSQRSGCIVNVTSMVGKVAAIAQSPYVASKFAFEGVSEGLAQELAPFGIRVAIIEPGVTKTAIYAKAGGLPNTTGAYDAAYRRMLRFYRHGVRVATDPVEVARVIHHAITTDRPALRYVMSWAGEQLVDGRPAMTDSDWVDLGSIADDDEYFRRFEAHFGLAITD
jgi:NAD(P)-dependent dehydrogenase (short-subunit alcohol dehydrogenase family)